MFDTYRVLYQAVTVFAMNGNAARNVEKPVSRDCPLCGYSRGIQLHRQRFELGADSPLPSEYEVVSCAKCAFVYADTSVNQAAYDHYYERNSRYEDAAISTGSGADELDRLRLERTASIITMLAKRFNVGERVVDIGCARGGLLRVLRARGFLDLSGMDPSQACIDEITRSGLIGIQTKVSEISGQPESRAYTLIVLSHVLEHIYDLLPSMQRIAGLLRKGGVVYVEVPDAARYSLHGFPPFYFFDCEHINHFDIDGLRNMARVSSFAVIAHGAHEIDVGGGRKYPAVWAALRRNVTPLSAPTPALQLRSAVAEYIAQSAVASRYDALEVLATSRRPVMIWGAGSHTQRLLADSPLARCNITAIVDRNNVKQGHALLGITVSEPEMTLQCLTNDTAIVVASVLHASEIVDAVRAKGLPNDVIIAN